LSQRAQKGNRKVKKPTNRADSTRLFVNPALSMTLRTGTVRATDLFGCALNISKAKD
jgi:hypothetical protein